MKAPYTQAVDAGQVLLSKDRYLTLEIKSLTSNVAVVVYDGKLGGIAHIILPDSQLDPAPSDDLPGKYADLALPLLWEAFLQDGGDKRNTTVRLIGGAQLFNFGGGGSNPLNVGARNVMAVRTTLARLGVVLTQAETGGNKAYAVSFQMSDGLVRYRRLGEDVYYDL
jgi:chemotaxis protein CheD